MEMSGTPYLTMNKTIQTQISKELDQIISAIAKSQMVSRAAVVRQLIVKALDKTREGQI